MKNLLYSLLVIVSLTSNAQTQQSLLWEVSGNGLEEPSYIFGTIHLIPKNDYYFTDAMQKAFDKAEVLVVEADMFSMSLSEKIDVSMQMFLPQGETLKDYMDSTEYANFVQLVADSIGIKPKKFNNKYARIKPFFLSAVLLQSYIGKAKTYEKELYDMSKKQKMELKALETVAFQMGLTQHLSTEDALKDLDDMSQYHMYFDMVELYKNQDIDGLYGMSMLEYQTEAELEFMEIFVNQRNADWIPKIDSLTKANSCFIAVGALHFPGEKGVLKLLEEAGYSVKALK